MIKILWIDDEPEKQDAFFDDAFLRGIELHSFKTFKQGLDDLEKNLKNYQGIILDAKAPYESENEVADLKGLPLAIARIHELRSKVNIPVFVFTGQPDLMSNGLFETMLGNTKCYTKGLETSLLLEAAIEGARNLKDTQIRHKYHKVFELCSPNYIGEDAASVLLTAIKSIEEDQPDTNFKDSFTPIRKIMERLFTRLNKLSIIPDEIYTKEGWVNKSSLFLAGKHDKFSISEGTIHPVICSLLHSFLQITQDSSHDNPNLRLQVSQYVDEMHTSYLFQSTLFQLFEILVWFKKFIDDHPDPEHNKKLWSEIVPKSPPDEIWIQGEVIQIASNGWGTFRPDTSEKTISILPAIVKQLNLQEKDRIEITTKPDPTGTKTYIDQIRRLTL